ncbi:carboxyl transferase domain-containing protein [uncultured Albimonas sp.]|uniref:acyl-CoA carboxylase subunit beta n=1 Tax=uncultured Albimonas sp. TaxID=1331701 RepID=UPI0030ED2D99
MPRDDKEAPGWGPEVEALDARRARMREMGGEANIARHHARGKLTARERLEMFADPGSFREIHPFSADAVYEGETLAEFTPKGLIEGSAKVRGRKVVVTAGDFTVKGGSGRGSRGGLGQEIGSAKKALQWRLPYVRLLDAVGGSVRGFEALGRTYLPDGNDYIAPEVELLQEVPVASAVLGSVAGLPAVQAPLSHFSVMVKGISQIFPGGPPVVKAAFGLDITKEELGGDQIHTRVSGCIDNVAATEAEAMEMVATWLSYLPPSREEMAPRHETGDDPERREDWLLEAMPRDRRKVYDARRILNAIVDRDSFFEIAPMYGKSRITGLARLNGYPVGIMINNPRALGGATDAAAGSKSMRLMQLCDLFNLPLISLADEPGFLVGLESEKQGIERAGARMVSTVCLTTMPWCTVVMGRLYGVAGQCHHRASGMFQRMAWPSANWGSMHIAGGVSAAYRAEIEAAPDPEAKRAEIEARLNAIANPLRTAEATGQDIIDPRDTRARLCEFVEEAQRVLARQLGRSRMAYLP